MSFQHREADGIGLLTALGTTRPHLEWHPSCIEAELLCEDAIAVAVRYMILLCTYITDPQHASDLQKPVHFSRCGRTRVRKERMVSSRSAAQPNPEFSYGAATIPCLLCPSRPIGLTKPGLVTGLCSNRVSCLLAISRC